MLWLWNANTGEKIITLQGERSGSVRRFAFSPDSRLLATNVENLSIQLFDTSTGQIVKSLNGFGIDMLFSPDGTTLTTYTLNTVQLWDTFTGELINRIVSLHPHSKLRSYISMKNHLQLLVTLTEHRHFGM